VNPRLVWLPEAQADLKQAISWYEAIRADLALRFAIAVDQTVDAISRNPFQFAVVYQNRRRAGVRRFPYGIFFELDEQRIVVIACFHAKRNPIHWQLR
jgi:plasmid stabilization system protein ParE